MKYFYGLVGVLFYTSVAWANFGARITRYSITLFNIDNELWRLNTGYIENIPRMALNLKCIIF